MIKEKNYTKTRWGSIILKMYNLLCKKKKIYNYFIRLYYITNSIYYEDVYYLYILYNYTFISLYIYINPFINIYKKQACKIYNDRITDIYI